MSSNSWPTIHTKLRDRLSGEAKSAQVVAKLPNDYNAFKASRNQLHTKHAERASLIHDKITPCFEHIISFERAITSAVSDDTALNTLWAGLYRIFEVYSVTADYTRGYTDYI
jgi:hypothetical protein